MIQQAIEVLNAVVDIGVATKHGLAQIVGGMPAVHQGAGNYTPIPNDANGSWSYWRVNGQPSATQADIGEACAGVDLSIPFRYVAWVPRDECSDAIVGAVNAIRLAGRSLRVAVGAVTVDAPRVAWGIDTVNKQEYSGATQWPTTNMLVHIDATLRIVASEDCLSACGDGLSVLCRLMDGASNAQIIACLGAERLSEICGDDLCATINAANSSEVIACVVENGDVPVYLCGFIATDEATADIGVECIGNAGKTADYQALLCPPCDPLSIAINGVAAFDVTDPCGNVYDIPIADSNGSIVPVTIVGDQVRVDDLPCAPCDPLSINVNGVEYGTVTDPCGGVAIVDVVNDLLAAVGSLVGGVWKIAKSRIYATDGVTLVQSIQPETNFSLPQSTIKYTDASNVAQVTAPSDTEFSTTLRPATLVPRRQILNTAGNPANSTFADLDDLISGTMPVAQDASIQRKDSASANIGLPISAPSNATTNMTCPDATVQLKDSAGTNIGSADSYKSNSSNNKTAPDGTVTINNSVPTTLHTVAVKSNGSVTQAIADSTITKPDGTTVGLPATVALDVRTYKSGIAYPYGRAQWSGQTTVHRTGDEGTWLADGLFDHFNPVYPDHYATLTNITTLASNNIYGNTLRFTDRTGAAAATSGNRVIQDHLTGIEWYIPSSLPAATTWNNAIDAAESSSVESSTDWHIPPFKVMATITRMDQTAPLNYGGFLVTVDVWTSTTNPDVTTAALRCTASTNGTFPSVAKSTNNSYIYCRKFI